MEPVKSFISKILDEPTSQPITKFIPQIKISAKSTLHLQIQPSDPHTASTITINAYQSKTNRTLVPVKIQWSRYKLKSDSQFTVEKVPGVVGNAYACEPADLGCMIQAKVRCLDVSVGGQAQATIGPIRIDPMIKRLIDGALYNESLLSQVIVVEGEDKFNVNFRLTRTVMEFTELNTSQKLSMPYSFSQPKLQLSPKDPCKVYLRFEQDTANTVRAWLNKLTQKQQSSRMNQSSMSIKIPHSNVSSMTSKTKLFQKPHTSCINKLQTKFLSRSSRDLFLFTLRAFICKEDMKNAVIMERIETLQALKTEEDYDRFLQYVSLKGEVVRLGEIARQLQTDRDNKLKDIANMQQSISQMTLTYLKIIQQKSQQQHVDLQQSYSMISMKRQQILGRKNLRQLKSQNQSLKTQIRQLNQQLELQKFFKKDDNQSMIFNRTTNPFMKKHNTSGLMQNNNGDSYYLGTPEIRKQEPVHKNMLEISKSYMKVLEENKRLKAKGKGSRDADESRDIENLLQSLHGDEEEDSKMREMQGRIDKLGQQLAKLKEVNSRLSVQNNRLLQQNNQLTKKGASQQLNTSSYSPSKNYSYMSNNQSLLSQNTSYLSANQSMTSQAQLVLLQKKLIELSSINQKFQTQNTRLRRERDYWRGLSEKDKGNNGNSVGNSSIKQPLTPTNDPLSSNRLSNDSQLIQSNLITNLRQQNQKLQNQKNSLLKKIDSLTRQSNSISTKYDPTLQKRYIQLQQSNQQLLNKNQALLQQIQALKKTIQNIRNFHELEKRELAKGNTNSNGDDSRRLLSAKQEEIDKLKKTNSSLLSQVKQLRMQLEKRKDNQLDNSRVIELQSQLAMFKKYSKISQQPQQSSPQPQPKTTPHPTIGQQQMQQYNQQLIAQTTTLRKQNQRLKQQLSTLQLKNKTLTSTIQKLMTEIDSHSFNDKYLGNEQLEKYKRRVAQLEHQVQIFKRNSQAVNRSRDLSMSMMGYQQQRLQLYKKEVQSLTLQNQNLSKMCSKYAKDAREANIQLAKLRQKLININKDRLVAQESAV